MRSTGLPEQRNWLRVVLAAFGLTTICLAHVIEPLVKPSHLLVYHWSGRSSALFGPPVVQLVLVFGLLATLLISAERQGSLWRSFVWVAVVLFLPWVVLHQAVTVWGASWLPHWFRLPHFYFAVIAWPLLAWACYRWITSRLEGVIETASMILAFTALSGFLFSGQMFWFWWQARDLNQPRALHQTASLAVPAGKPRVILVLLDELSYQQLYEDRAPNLQLPAFDALAGEATVFTHVAPAANYTEKAVPALLSGQPVDDIRGRSDGMLEVRAGKHASWQVFDERKTIFKDAIEAGYSTTLVGWFNPYCRILPDVLDSCYWTDAYTMANGLASEGSFKSNFVSSADTLVHPPTVLQRDVSSGEAHLDDFLHLKTAADTALLDRFSGLTFIHLPIPHPDGIYNRATHQFTIESSTYIDNLALADRYLAHIRSLLQKSGQWDSSTIVVMGDHGWRTFIWEHQHAWTDSEERASLGGKFDPRPAYIVKLAGQTSGMRIDTPFEAIRTRALTDELLAGEIQSPEELRQWVDK